MEVELIGTDDRRWRRLVETADPDDYQLPAWAKISARSEGGEPLGLFGCGRDGEFLVPLIARELPPLGHPDLSDWRDATSPYGCPGALMRGHFTAELGRVEECVTKALRQRQILACFIRMNPMRSAAAPILERLGTVVDEGETVFYDLRLDEEAIWNSTRENHRKDINRLKTTGHWTRINDWSDLEAFKGLYRNTMQRVGARPFYLFDDVYFDQMRDLLGDRLNLVSVVSPEGAVISAGLFLTGGERTAHLHLIGSSESQVKACKLVYDSAWRWFKRSGVHSLHMGGGLGRPNDPLLHFKRGLAKGRANYRTVRLVSDTHRYRLASATHGVEADSLTGFFPAYRRAALNSSATVTPGPRGPSGAAEEAAA